MNNYNVYEQRFPLQTARSTWRSQMIFFGMVEALNIRTAIEAAKLKYRIRAPAVHLLDGNGNEVAPFNPPPEYFKDEDRS